MAMQLSLIQGEVDRLSHELDKLEHERAILEGKIVPFRNELHLWKGILKSRQLEFPDHVMLGSPNTAIITGPNIEGVDDGDSEYGRLSYRFRDLIHHSGDSGVSMRELKDLAESLDSHPNAAYRFVDRLAKGDKPELRKDNGRVYATEHLKLKKGR